MAKVCLDPDGIDVASASANSRKPGALAIWKVCTTEGYVCEDDGRTLLSSDVSFPIELGVRRLPPQKHLRSGSRSRRRVLVNKRRWRGSGSTAFWIQVRFAEAMVALVLMVGQEHQP